ncbi:VOC family protein [Bacillus sp. T33-2]|uniref:VOC family protein n=1 Tax=Bacillus sp. T33-2 TaxID=2054168 RepID=UPI000C761856|nr:VOC family protein [Bacillus sp. T33-2]PLR96894.1 hypothetical protein CVD19_09905 [Bacillus sp. T33-2]
MRLVFLSQPVKDIKKAVAFYRDVLGMEEAWREGDHTVAIQTSSDVQILLEDEEVELEIGAGGIYVVDSVDKFYNDNMVRLTFIKEPRDIPPGRYAIFSDVSGNPIRIIDMTKQ